MAVLSFPKSTRFFLTRKEAREAKNKGERVHSLGIFADGSFGLFARGNKFNKAVVIRVWATIPD